MKKEINSHDWGDFCNRITRERQGAMVTIETIFPDGEKRVQAENAPLVKMVFDTTDSCNDVIQLRVRTNREEAYNIEDPRHIILQESQGGQDFNPLEIDGENGTTFLTFRPAIHANMLAGLKVD
jgi:hypothetical protein